MLLIIHCFVDVPLFYAYCCLVLRRRFVVEIIVLHFFDAPTRVLFEEKKNIFLFIYKEII